jgi:glycosyltransferase involved in cell wall biosynthesis
VIENGVDVDLFDPSRLEEMPPRQELVVGTAGRLTAQKNLSLLLEAFAAIPPCPRGPLLEIAGEGPMRSALEQRARALGIAERARFLGEVPREGMPAPGALRSLRLPSRWRRSGLRPPRLAMARAGRFRVDGLAEPIETAGVILLSPDSPLAWASSLRACSRIPRVARSWAPPLENGSSRGTDRGEPGEALALFDELLLAHTQLLVTRRARRRPSQ